MWFEYQSAGTILAPGTLKAAVASVSILFKKFFIYLIFIVIVCAM